MRNERAGEEKMINGFRGMITERAIDRGNSEEGVQFSLSREEIIDKLPKQELMPTMDFSIPDFFPGKVGQVRSIGDPESIINEVCRFGGEGPCRGGRPENRSRLRDRSNVDFPNLTYFISREQLTKETYVPAIGIVINQTSNQIVRRIVEGNVRFMGRFMRGEGRDPRIIPNSNNRINRDGEAGTFGDQIFGRKDISPNPRGVGRREISGEERLEANVLGSKKFNPKLVMRRSNRPSKLADKNRKNRIE